MHFWGKYGQGIPDRAKITEEGGNIDGFLRMTSNSTVGPFKSGALDIAKIIKLAMGIIGENKPKSDEKIMDEHGGTQKNTDSEGNSIIKVDTYKTDTIVTPEGSRIDTMLVRFRDNEHPTEVYVRYNQKSYAMGSINICAIFSKNKILKQ